VKLFVVKQNRFNVPVVKAREALDASRFGKLILGTVRVRWCRHQAYYDQEAASNILALPEQVGDNGLLFDPNSAPSIKAAIQEILNNPRWPKRVRTARASAWRR
jgi:hypothetical protein